MTAPSSPPDPRWGPAECRLCGRPILWAESSAGARVAFDGAPVVGGEFVILVEAPEDESDPDWVGFRKATIDDDPLSPRYRLHFGLCTRGRAGALPSGGWDR